MHYRKWKKRAVAIVLATMLLAGNAGNVMGSEGTELPQPETEESTEEVTEEETEEPTEETEESAGIWYCGNEITNILYGRDILIDGIRYYGNENGLFYLYSYCQKTDDKNQSVDGSTI